jgi:hypothetical protein
MITSWLQHVYTSVQHVYTSFTSCLHHVYSRFTSHLHNVCTMFTLCLQQVNTIFTSCLHHVYKWFTPYLQVVYTINTPCFHRVYTIFIPGLHHIYSVLHQVYFVFTPCLQQIYTIFTSCLNMFTPRSHHEGSLMTKQAWSNVCSKVANLKIHDHEYWTVGLSVRTTQDHLQGLDLVGSSVGLQVRTVFIVFISKGLKPVGQIETSTCKYVTLSAKEKSLHWISANTVLWNGGETLKKS